MIIDKYGYCGVFYISDTLLYLYSHAGIKHSMFMIVESYIYLDYER